MVRWMSIPGRGGSRQHPRWPSELGTAPCANCSCRWEPVTWQIVFICLLSLELSNEHSQKPGGTGGCRASLESGKDMCHLQRILVLLVVQLLSHVQLFATSW